MLFLYPNSPGRALNYLWHGDAKLRKIRESKRKLIAYDEGIKQSTGAQKGEFQMRYAFEGKRLSKLNAQLDDFCSQTGLQKQYDRARVLGFGRSEAQISKISIMKSAKAIDNSTKNGIIEKNVFRTDDDPMREVFGSAFDSNRKEIEAMLKNFEAKGVDVVFKDGVMAYQPNPVSGKPGRIVIDKKASFSAFKHEERHVIDDEATGWLGFRNFMDRDTAIRFEVNAYDIEIALAKQYALPDMVEKLEKLKNNRRRELLDE